MFWFEELLKLILLLTIPFNFLKWNVVENLVLVYKPFGSNWLSNLKNWIKYFCNNKLLKYDTQTLETTNIIFINPPILPIASVIFLEFLL